MSFSWEQVQKIFEKARGLRAEKRAGFLEKACAGDAALRAEVESLLGHLDQAGAEFLKTYQPPEAGDRADRKAAQSLDADPDATHAGPVRGERPADALANNAKNNAGKDGGKLFAGVGADSDAGDPSPDDILASGRGLLGIPSDLIDGYTLLRELHRGGQGIVYQAIQKGTKRKVAIKVLLEGPFASKSARRRFEREIELVARLRHANIVEVFHSGQTPDGRQYCVMDYVRGTPLDQYVRAKKLSMEDALALFTNVCEAVNYAHQRGVIHRDLKPSNILVDSEGVPKVLDFGLAKQLSGPDETMVSLTGQVVGTLPYMSPEQTKGNPDEIDIRTDVYSLGVILYEVLTGTYPYPVVGQMAEVLNHIASTPPTPPSRTWQKDSGVQHRTARKLRAGLCPIDDGVQTIVLRSLAKEPSRRYQSAGELAKDVEHYLKDEPIEAKKDSRLYILKAAIKRNRAAFSIAATFVLLVLGSAVGMLVLASRADQEKSARLVEEEKRAQLEIQARISAERIRPRALSELLDALVFLDESQFQKQIHDAWDSGIPKTDLEPFAAVALCLGFESDKSNSFSVKGIAPNVEGVPEFLSQLTRAFSTNRVDIVREISAPVFDESELDLNPLLLASSSILCTLQGDYSTALRFQDLLESRFSGLRSRFHLRAVLFALQGMMLHDNIARTTHLKQAHEVLDFVRKESAAPHWVRDLYCGVSFAILDESNRPLSEEILEAKGISKTDDPGQSLSLALLEDIEREAKNLISSGCFGRGSMWLLRKKSVAYSTSTTLITSGSGSSIDLLNPPPDRYSQLADSLVATLDPILITGGMAKTSGIARIEARRENNDAIEKQNKIVDGSDSGRPDESSTDSRQSNYEGYPNASTSQPEDEFMVSHAGKKYPVGVSPTYNPDPEGDGVEDLPEQLINTGSVPGCTHIVKPNETFEDLAQVYYGRQDHWRMIFYANQRRVKNPANVEAGTKLIIPIGNTRISQGAGSSVTQQVRRVNVKLAGPAIGTSPHYLAYSTDLPLDEARQADFLWMDNGIGIGDEPRGVKILESPGLHRISVLVVTQENIEFRGTATVQVLDRGPGEAGK